MGYADNYVGAPGYSEVPFSSSPPISRYHPMGQHQDQRLIHMLDLDHAGQFYKHTNMRDFHLMESLRKRGYVWFTGEDWFLSDAGKAMAEKLSPSDGLPF